MISQAEVVVIFTPGTHEFKIGPGTRVLVDGQDMGHGMSLSMNTGMYSSSQEIEITFVQPNGTQVRVQGYVNGDVKKNEDGSFTVTASITAFHEDRSQSMDRVDATSYGDHDSKITYRAGVNVGNQLHSFALRQAMIGKTGKTIDGLFLDEELHMMDQKVTDDSQVDPAPEVDVDWGCCEAPRPAIHNATGRFFCLNCRHWLDRASATSGDSNATGDAPNARASGTSVDQAAPAKARRSRRKQKE